MRLSALVLTASLVLAVPGVSHAGPAEPARAATGLKVTTQVTGLTQPWDVQSIGKGRLLITERDSARLLLANRTGATRAIRFPASTVWASGETGLMSLEVDPRFAKNRRIYTCQGGTNAAGKHDVRVIAWRLDKRLTRARLSKVLLRGLPATSGRHGGCRLLIARGGALLVGTGDAAVGSNPRNLGSLGGKVLRLNRHTGRPWPSNPFIKGSGKRRYVFTYGHRNVQGLAQRADGSLWSVEHGTWRDDEVNRLVRGGDFGYHPVPGYNEEVPMTDQGLPGTQQAARWSSGEPTIATSGAAFVPTRRWGQYAGSLAVAALGGERMLFLTFDKQGRLQRQRTPAALRRFGRLRSVTVAPGGDLLVTTANGADDVVLRVSPR